MRAKLGALFSLARKRPLLSMISLLLVSIAALVAVDTLVAGKKADAQIGQPRARGAEGRGGFETGLSAKDVHRNLSKGYGERVSGVEGDVTSLRREIQGLKSTIETLSKQVNAKDESIQDLTQVVKGLREKNGSDLEGLAKTTLARIRKFDLSTPADEPQTKTLHIPAGSFGKGTLLSGVYAPTTGEPLPVLIKLDSALIGPSRSRIPLAEVFLIGKARGDANSARATIQLDRISLVREDGRSIEIPVNGWIIDSDGIQGVRGQYVWRAKEILGLSALSSGAAAASDALAAGETTNQLNPLGGATSILTGNALKLAGFRALSGMTDRMSEVVLERMREIQPAIYAGNGKKITIAFVSGVTISGYPKEELENESDRHPYHGLDSYR